MTFEPFLLRQGGKLVISWTKYKTAKSRTIGSP